MRQLYVPYAGTGKDLRSVDDSFALICASNLRSIENRMLTKHDNDGT